ncbi:MAG: hypothetical protein WAT39_00680 [Planctomycetota bacterium]
MTTVAQIRKKLEALRGLPAKVRAWRIKDGEDNLGEPAIWVWVTLDDADLSEPNRDQIRESVRAAVRNMAKPAPSWVYVRFRGASEDAA